MTFSCLLIHFLPSANEQSKLFLPSVRGPCGVCVCVDMASKQASFCPPSLNTMDYFSALIQAGFLRAAWPQRCSLYSEASTNYSQGTRVASASASARESVAALLNSIDSFHPVPRDSESHILTSLAPCSTNYCSKNLPPIFQMEKLRS